MAGSVCILLGLGMFTFVSARGDSYLSDSPDTCINCHVMRPQFEAWGHSSHARVATCNDCHTPHDNIVSKWFVKGLNGFNHSFAFTFNTYDEVITIHDFNAQVVQQNCVSCHTDTVTHMVNQAAAQGDAPPNCLTCHAGIGHPTRD